MLRKLLKVLFVTGLVLFLALLLLIFFIMYLPVQSNMSEWQRRANRGESAAQYGLGTWYLTGQMTYTSFGRVRQDNKKAVFYLGLAARSGEKHAYFSYAQALERDGQREAAAIWYKKAEAEQAKAKHHKS